MLPFFVGKNVGEDDILPYKNVGCFLMAHRVLDGCDQLVMRD